MSVFPRGTGFDPFSLGFWDPFDDFPFGTGGSLVPRASSSETATFAGARVDWKETPEAHVFKADVPGLKKEEVEDGNVLLISGERSKEQEEKTNTWHRVERSSGKFMHRSRLPDNAKVDQVKAAMENDVLTVTRRRPRSPTSSPSRSPVRLLGIYQIGIPAT
jgi:HSP20 family protein